MAADALNRCFVERIYEVLVAANRSQLKLQAELFSFDIFRAFQSLRSQFKGLRDNEPDGKINKSRARLIASPTLPSQRLRKSSWYLGLAATNERVRDCNLAKVAAF
jgi:hypothetical protein